MGYLGYEFLLRGCRCLQLSRLCTQRDSWTNDFALENKNFLRCCQISRCLPVSGTAVLTANCMFSTAAAAVSLSLTFLIVYSLNLPNHSLENSPLICDQYILLTEIKISQYIFKKDNSEFAQQKKVPIRALTMSLGKGSLVVFCSI